MTFHEGGRLPLDGLRNGIFNYYRQVLPNEGDGAQLDLYSPYSMHQRCVEKMRVGRVLLAGDSAHVTNPASGFGLTGGIFDACTLTDVLGPVAKGEADERLLDAYSAARRKVFLEVSSPISCETKRRTFHLTDAEIYAERERQIEAQKHDLGWESGSRGYYSFQLETPSLIDGRTSAEERPARYGQGPLVWDPEGGFA